MSEIYSIDDKRRLAEKIENTKNKELIEKIKKIIFKENPDINITKNSSGLLIYFHNLTEKTYSKILKLFDDIENNKIKELKKTITDTNDMLMSEVGELNQFTETIYKLSNKEKNILKRKQYEKDIGEEEDPDIYLSEDDCNKANTSTQIFIKKSKGKKSK